MAFLALKFLSSPSLPEEICRLAVHLKIKTNLYWFVRLFQSTVCIVAPIPVFQGVVKPEIHWFVFPSLSAVELSFNTYYPDDFWQRAVWKSFSRINCCPRYLRGRRLVNWPFYTTAHGQLLWKVPEVYYNNIVQNKNWCTFVRSLLCPDFLCSFNLIDVCLSQLSTISSRFLPWVLSAQEL